MTKITDTIQMLNSSYLTDDDTTNSWLNYNLHIRPLSIVDKTSECSQKFSR